MSSSSSTKNVRVQKSSSVAFYECMTFQFTWTIKDYNTWITDAAPNGSGHRSPVFPSGKRESFQWRVRFEPKSREDQTCCGLFVHAEKFPGAYLNAELKFILMDSAKTIFCEENGLKCKFEKNDGCGYGLSKLVEINTLLDRIKKDDVLIIISVIEAKVRLVDEIVQPTSTDQPAPLSSIADDFATLVDGQQYGDVTVKIVDRKFRVYKGILASRSPVFAAMFEHTMKEKIKNVVTIDDVEPDVFSELLRYIYTDKVRNLTTLAYKLYAAADKYDVRTLKALCQMSILGNLTMKNATKALKCADLHQDNEMKQGTLEFLCNNFENLLTMTESAGWKKLERAFPQLVIEVLKAIVKA